MQDGRGCNCTLRILLDSRAFTKQVSAVLGRFSLKGLRFGAPCP